MNCKNSEEDLTLFLCKLFQDLEGQTSQVSEIHIKLVSQQAGTVKLQSNSSCE